MTQRIPVVMHHSIGVVNNSWQWKWLTCPYEIFEDQLKWLKRLGFNTLNFQEVYDYIMLDKPIPQRSVFLTFDDGYYDNYFFAYPLLKKYGMKGTIFINPDFVDRSTGLRKTMDDFVGKEQLKNFDSSGFCNWDELRKIDKEGILDVQSHAKTHTWYPISDKIIDFRHVGDDYIWMDWNDNPDKKPNLQYIIKNEVKYGKAVFENNMALSAPRIFINEEFQNMLSDFVVKKGNSEFFKMANWRSELEDLSEKLRQEYEVVTHKETREEYLERIIFELSFTKKEIELKLKKEVKFLCWPGGSGTKEGVEIAQELGYQMFTAANEVTEEERSKIVNSPEHKINKITRFSPVMLRKWSNIDKEFIHKYSPGYFFILQILTLNGNHLYNTIVTYLCAIILRIYKLPNVSKI